MQWRRAKNGSLELYVEEDGKWKHYSQSVLKKPELPEKTASRGFPTMQACLKAGYQYLDMEGNPIET